MERKNSAWHPTAHKSCNILFLHITNDDDEEVYWTVVKYDIVTIRQAAIEAINHNPLTRD